MLLEALDCFSEKIELTDIGYWAVNLQTQEFTLSESGRIMYGVPKEIKLTLEDGLKMIDPQHQNEITNAIENTIKSGVGYIKQYKINPLDGSSPKWIKTSGNVIYNDDGTASALTGNLVLVNC
jgi:PAS domain-containing protein